MALSIEQIRQKKAEITGPEGFFAVHDIELDGRQYRAYQHAPKTLMDLWQGARGHGDAEFMVYEDERYSYSQFFAGADAMAAYLQNSLKIVAGQRVAIAMRNNPQWAMSFVAITSIGAIAVPVNSWGKAAELQYALEDSGAAALVCDKARYELLAAGGAAPAIPTVVAGDVPDASGVVAFDDALKIARDEGLEAVPVTPDPADLCVILYTSGSTGFPKGVAHRHIAVCQSLMNMMYLGYLLMELEGAREFKGGAEREAPLVTVPLFHATGLLGGLIMPLFTGQKLVMMYKWDNSKALKLIESEKVTTVATVPAIIKDLLDSPEFDKHDTSSVIRVAAAGAATPDGLPELIEEKFCKPSRSAGYGMTETMAVCSTMSGAIFDMSPQSAGLMSPIMDVRFVGPDGTVLPESEAGEIQMRGVTCMQGYWEKPEADAATFAGEGWMKTGDIGKMDADGFLHITGRIKEIVIRGGENIYPGEIESAAWRHAGIHEVVVFGVPDDAMGEELVMVAMPNDSGLTPQALRNWMKEELAGYKVPKTIVFSENPLPRNASEKLHKLRVKEQFLDGLYPA